VLHGCEETPTHSAPPFDGSGLVHVRVITPLHVALHSVKLVQPPLTGAAGHASVLHACVEVPLQGRPPLAGAGLVHVRVTIPPPHETEHDVLH
jgi:hypothetical protein